MADQSQDHDQRDDLIASLRAQLQLQEQREAETTKKYVDLLLSQINNVPPSDQQACILPAIKREHQIVEAQISIRKAELQLLDQQLEVRAAQYKQLQSQYRELEMMSSIGFVSQHNTLNIFQGQIIGTVPPEAVNQGSAHDLAVRLAPGASEADASEASHKL